MLRFPSEALTDALSEANMFLNSNTPLLWQAKAATEVSQKSKMSANGVWRGSRLDQSGDEKSSVPNRTAFGLFNFNHFCTPLSLNLSRLAGKAGIGTQILLQLQLKC